MCPPLMYNVRVYLKRLGCLVARVFYHMWSKLGRIVNVDPKDTKNTKIVKILFWGHRQLLKGLLDIIPKIYFKFTYKADIFQDFPHLIPEVRVKKICYYVKEPILEAIAILKMYS